MVWKCFLINLHDIYIYPCSDLWIPATLLSSISNSFHLLNLPFSHFRVKISSDIPSDHTLLYNTSCYESISIFIWLFVYVIFYAKVFWYDKSCFEYGLKKDNTLNFAPFYWLERMNTKYMSHTYLVLRLPNSSSITSLLCNELDNFQTFISLH